MATTAAPWSVFYHVRRPLSQDAGQVPDRQFTFDASGEEMGKGGEARRGILLGPSPRPAIDYRHRAG